VAKLLMVDDDSAALGWMAPALESRGHEVKSFTRAADALEALEHWTPDLIIADILMAEMDGLTFARVARRHRGVPIMFISVAKKQAEAVITGALGYVQKPATASEVREAVERVLGRRAERNTILVVDDDISVRELYQLILQPRFVVVGAEHGLAALDMLARRPIDLAVVDVHMPVMNGVELIRRIRADAALANLPVIVQTSDYSALGAPVWRDLNVSQVVDKGSFFDWIYRQIDLHVTGKTA